MLNRIVDSSVRNRKEFRRKLATGPIGELLWTGRPVVVPDAEANPVLAAELALEHPFGSCLLVQMSVDHRTVGYLYADSPERGAFTEKDVPVFQAFADVASLALHRAQLVEENLRLDRIDHETELEKYGPFLQGLGSLFESAMTFDESLGVMVLDVDNYKTIVNTYGYDASKQFLHELGGLVRSEMASSGKRMPGTSLKQCRSSRRLESSSNMVKSAPFAL